MLAHAIQSEVELAKDNADIPVYGGFEDLEILREQLNKIKSSNQFDSHIRKRATKHIKQLGDSNSRALTEIGDVHFQNKAFGRAIKAYTKALKLESENIPTFKKLIQALLVTGKVTEADKYYKLLLEKVNNHPRYTTEYLSFRIMISIFDEAHIKESQKIIEANKNSSNDAILNAVGLFEHLVNKDPATAKTYYLKALSINDENIDANNNIGLCFRNEMNYKSAEKFLQKAHYLDLKYQSAYENLAGLYYIQNKMHKAISILENADSNRVQLSTDWKHNFAFFYFLQGAYKRSITKYKELFISESDNSLVLNNIGANYEKLGEISEAKKYFSDAVTLVRRIYKNSQSLDDRGALAFINLARLLVKEDKFDDALKILGYVHRIYPTNNVSYHVESIIHSRQNDFQSAKKKLEKSLQLNPSYLDSAVDLSYILEEIDLDYQSAVQVLEKVDADPADPLSIIRDNNLAFAYLKTGRPEKARPLLRDEDDSFASYATKGLYYLLKNNVQKFNAMYDLAKNKAPKDKLRNVMQSYHFELMEYWDRNNDTRKALINARKCLEFSSNLRINEAVKEYISSHE